MKKIDNISERYRKYLLQIVFEEQMYYTVSGADFSDQETDKLLVDADGNILLFSLPADLLSVILKGTSFFDNGILQEWAREINGIEESYAVINLDLLGQNNFYLNDVDLLKSIYDTLGIVEDYANQINDERLLALLEKDILLQFKDDLASYFIWSENKAFKTFVHVDALLLLLKEIHTKLKERLNIYQ
ncbi:hypothetical protein [Chitinophaga solisilvae]|uniref:hypothetical protein n=1 Tax=Chitinophaga solisilvae TaxID=1233460 RepID=UPI00136AE7B9|nr:hypothetical protein [Chitinophaga solisilvae]